MRSDQYVLDEILGEIGITRQYGRITQQCLQSRRGELLEFHQRPLRSLFTRRWEPLC